MSDPAAMLGVLESPFELNLSFVEVPVRILTNDEDLWAGLHHYYAPYVIGRDRDPVAVVRLIQGTVPPGLGPFIDVRRGGGKGVKEAIREVPGGRFILKKTTGVVMALWPDHAVAAGNVRANLNQGINLINACYAKAVLRRGHRLLHASGVSWNGRAAALAGPAGAGKSTAALHFVEEGFRFLSNDRILARRLGDGAVEALGYPKQPRVNPGTLLHHPRLRTLLKPEDRESLSGLAPAELWRLERKSDVDLDAIYGPGTVELRGRLHVLALLKWSPDGRGLSVRQIDTAEALTNVPIFHKDLGVFDLDRPVRGDGMAECLSDYTDLLSRLTAIEVTGRTDFPALVDFVGDLLAH